MYNPQNLNRFGYVGNNPINFNDPTGHFTCSNDRNSDDYCPGRTGVGSNFGSGSGSTTYEEPPPGSDITEWLVNEFATEAEYLETNFSCPGWMVDFKCNDYILNTHLSLFGNRKRYDTKILMQEKIGGAVILCGSNGCKWVDYSTPGNILFGYLSASRGVNQVTAWVAGGGREILDWFEKGIWEGQAYQGTLYALGDNPGDKAAVDFGYELWEQYKKDISLQNFQDALTTDKLNSFQVPAGTTFGDPIPQPNIYPPGFFLDP